MTPHQIFAYVQMRNCRAGFEYRVGGFDLFVDGDWHGRVVAFLRSRPGDSNRDNARYVELTPFNRTQGYGD